MVNFQVRNLMCVSLFVHCSHMLEVPLKASRSSQTSHFQIRPLAIAWLLSTWCMSFRGEAPPWSPKHSMTYATSQYLHIQLTHYSKSQILVQNSTLISWEKVSNCFGWKLVKCWGFDFIAVDIFDFTRKKNCQKNFGWKTRENVAVLSKLNFCTKTSLVE